MRRLGEFSLALLITAFLIACHSTPPTANPSGYPIEITGGGDVSNFPAQAAGYTRGKMYLYRPGMTDHSVGYNNFGIALQSAVTLYFYPLDLPFEEQYVMEKAGILRAHGGATIDEEQQTSLQTNGIKYNARLATFTYEENFGGTQQKVFSELMLVQLPTRYFKVRSTAPASQAAEAKLRTLALLENVKWAY